MDASRAFILLARRGYVRSLHAFVDPGDPFVAALDLDPQDLAPGDVDFPEEGKPADADWASPGSPARKDPRHTFYSYSLQAGHSNMRAHPGLRLSQKLPLIGDRNPYHAVYKELTGGKAVTADSKAGNPWSHNRETAVVAFVDGRSEEVAANALEVPMNGADSPAFDTYPIIRGRRDAQPEGPPLYRRPKPAAKAAATPKPGFDHLYGDAAVNAAAVTPPTDGKAVKRGEAGFTHTWGSWLVD